MNLIENNMYETRSGSMNGYDEQGNRYHISTRTIMKFIRFEERPFVSIINHMERKEEKHYNFLVFEYQGKVIMIPLVKMFWYPDVKNNSAFKLDNSFDLMFAPASI